MTDPSPDTAAQLARVKRAAARKRRADKEYRSALEDARDLLELDGARDVYAQLAAAAGMSRQAVRQQLERWR